MLALRIGLVYDLLGTYPQSGGDPGDADVEYEPEETLHALEGAIRRLGHRPVRIGSPHDLLAQVGKGELPALDAALNIAEGYGGRNREAWAPVLLEMAHVPALGSDALTLSVTLDKVWAVAVVRAAGVPVPEQALAHSAREAENICLPGHFPLFVKPRWEGTAKGIRPSSRALDRASLVREVERIVRGYRQPALIEPFFAGPEYTVSVIGNDPPRALPVLQRALDAATRIGLHAVEAHAAPGAAGAPAETGGGFEPCLPGRLDAPLEAELGDLAVRAYRALECRDFARADFRLDDDGVPHFLEMNPLPTFASDGSFGILAELAGRPFEDLLAEVLAGGLARLGLARLGIP
jgi:D-alanine-D-alanine ligase